MPGAFCSDLCTTLWKEYGNRAKPPLTGGNPDICNPGTQMRRNRQLSLPRPTSGSPTTKGRGVIMGNGKKARPPEWREKATMCLQLLTSCTRLTVAFSMLIHAVNNWPL